MSTNLVETYACVPSTERGRGILISGDAKSNRILYCNGRSVFLRYLDRPLEVSVYNEHAYQVTVARFSPNGEWIASADVSGIMRIWGTHNDFVLKNEFRVLSGRIDDLQWSPDGMRIVASGDGKGKSFVRAFIMGYTLPTLLWAKLCPKLFLIHPFCNLFAVNACPGIEDSFKAQTIEGGFLPLIEGGLCHWRGSLFLLLRTPSFSRMFYELMRVIIFFRVFFGLVVTVFASPEESYLLGDRSALYALNSCFEVLEFWARRIAQIRERGNNAIHYSRWWIRMWLGCHGRFAVDMFYLLWDSGSNVGDFDGHSRRVLSCAFKPTRPFRIVTCGEDFLVNFYEGPPFKFKLSLRTHSNFVNCVRFSLDGSKFISVSSDKKGLLYDAKTAEKIGELSSENAHTGSIYAVSWSPDSKEVLTVSADKSAKVWAISEDGNGVVKKTLTCPITGGVEDMLVGCLWQNDYLVTVSLGGTISLFSASNLDKDPVTLCGHLKNVNSLAVVNTNQKVILSCSYDGLIFRWIQGIGFSGRLERKNVNNAQIKCFAAVEGEIVSSGYDNKIWRVPLLGGGDQCGDGDSVDIGSQPKDISLALDSPELALVAIETGVVLLCGTKVVSTTNLGFTVTACTITPDGSEAIVGGQDGKLHLYSVNGDTLEEQTVLEKHRGPITVIRYSPDVSMFASGDSNREAVVWDRATREVKLKNMLFHTARINCLAWSPDSSMVATGSLDTSVIIYEISKPASSRITIKGANLGGVYGVAFTDDQCVVSSGEDACVRVWRITK
ncbi:hypothetical protein LguiB_027320 [Lonicera macranthoides]